MPYMDDEDDRDGEEAGVGAEGEVAQGGVHEDDEAEGGPESDVIADRPRRRRTAAPEKKGSKLKWVLGGAAGLIFLLIALMVFISYARAAAKRERQKEAGTLASAAGDLQTGGGAGGQDGPTGGVDVDVVEQMRRDYGEVDKVGGGAGLPDLKTTPGDQTEGAGELQGGGVIPDPAFARPGAAQQQAQAGGEQAQGGGKSRLGASDYVWPSVPTNVSVRYAPVEVAARQGAAPEPKGTPQVSREGVDLTSGGRGGEAGRTIPAAGSRLKVVSAGAFFSPSSDESMVMLTTLSDERGDGWYLPAGTLFVGRVKGVVAKSRIEVSIFGFVDGNKLVTLKGNVLGEDMGVGMAGEVMNKEGLVAKFGRGVMNAIPIAAAALGPYRYVTSVLPGADGVNGYGRSGQDQSYVAVQGGVVGYVSILTLPESVQGRYPDAGGGAGDLSQAELELIKQIRASRGEK